MQPIVDEPVRGSVPPPWFGALSGLERMQALANGLVSLPPLFRLLGIRPGHIGPGSSTWTIPATPWLQEGTGLLEMGAILETVLAGTALTTVSAGATVDTITFSHNQFRPLRHQPGRVLARGRVLNSSRFFVCTEVEIEDPRGRRIAVSTSQAALRRIEPPPPPPPEKLVPIEEPTYETPDPIDRPLPKFTLPLEVWEREGGVAALTATRTAGTPYYWLTGFDLREVDVGRIVATIPASPWFCRFSTRVSPALLSSFANGVVWAGGLSLAGPNQTFVALGGTGAYYRSSPADGRVLRGEVEGLVRSEDRTEIRFQILDADGALVSDGVGHGVLLDASRRQARPKREAERVLATLLFLDVVDSTGHVEKIGDARWRDLLERFRTVIRNEISRHDGTEIDTAGDGFFVRFDSPAQAVECARAARDAAGGLGVEIRSGVHAGECEVSGRSLSGMAVHIGARIQAVASPGEILVSGTVRDLSIGSPLRFEDRGRHRLKGVPDEWALYALV